MNRTAILCTCIAAAGLIASAALVAGPLAPPAGPVASTYKTLADVEPRIAINAANTPGDANSLYRISKPGSYYLTGNIDGVAGKHIVVIAASDVSLDLNGFTVDGKSISNYGVALDNAAAPDNVAVRNGTIQACGGYGLYLAYGQGAGVRYTIEQLRMFDNNNGGCYIASHCIVRHCQASGNGGAGFTISSGILESCLAAGNAGSGLVHGGGSIADCESRNNTAYGLVAIHSTVTGCATHGNQLSGMSANLSVIEACQFNDGLNIQFGCVVRGNNCSRPGNTALLVSSTDNRIEGNTFTGSSIGLGVIQAGNIIVRNTASGNTINWTVVAGNALAPVVQASTNPANFNGNAYAGNLGSTDPNANFTY